MIPCFMLEPTDEARVWLRRYSKGTDHKVCPVSGYHNARAEIEGGKTERDRDCEGCFRLAGDSAVEDFMADPRWPTSCSCGYEFCQCGDPACVVDAYQLFWHPLYRRLDTGELTTIEEAPAGALWYADWLTVTRWKGPDGRTLVCKTPGGEWIIDAQASNCTLPDDHDHRCWVRHGTPPDVTVDKNGRTCGASAGSIQAGSYHGFLKDGHLTPA